MDERLTKALDFSNYMVTLNNQKRLLNEKYNEDLLFFFNGSQFLITKELITFVGLMLDKQQPSLILTDDNNIPTLITDVQDFFDSIIDVYTSASNMYYAQYQTLKKNRSVEKLIDNEEE